MSEPTTQAGKELLAYMRGDATGLVLIGVLRGDAILAIEAEAAAAERARLASQLRVAWALHRGRWACSEDRDSCDPDLNLAFHEAQAVSLLFWLGKSAMGPSGSVSILASGVSGSRSGVSATGEMA